MKPTVRLNKLLPLLAIAAILAAAAPRTAKFGYEYKRGGTWKYETLFAPFDFPILKTADQVHEELSKVSDARVPYYNYSEDVTRASLKAASELELGEMKPIAIASMKSIMERGVIADDAIPEETDVIYVQKDKRAVKVPSGEIAGLSAARARLIAELQSQAEMSSVDSLVKASGICDLIVPNLVFDQQTTDAVSSEATSHISPTAGYVSAGQLIVSEGEIITAEIAQILDSYKKEYEANVGSSGPAYLGIIGNVMVALLLVCLFFLAILFSGNSFLSDSRYYYLIFVFALCSLAIVIITRINPAWLFITPLTLAALYLQAFVRARVIVPVYMVSLMPLLVYADDGAALFIIFLAGGMVTIYFSRYLMQGWRQFVLALINFSAMALAYVALHLSGAVSSLMWGNILRLFIASLLAVAGYPLIYLFEKLFNLVSNSRLTELSDTSSPLLRELERKAPGTFQHSLQVMNMAEAAARAVEANPLLLRVGALYHDIGKLNNPLCFIENESMLNKADDQKYHTGLTPKQSAEDIIRHVADGVELAKKNRLPDIVIDFIRTHHGTTATGYFWGKYLSQKGDPADRHSFEYPGPAPTTKEQIVLMLCDSIEAASRTLTDYTPEAFSAFVERIVKDKMDQGQFRNAEISIKELTALKEAIKSYLAQMHHGRVAYPEARRKLFKFK